MEKTCSLFFFSLFRGLLEVCVPPLVRRLVVYLDAIPKKMNQMRTWLHTCIDLVFKFQEDNLVLDQIFSDSMDFNSPFSPSRPVHNVQLARRVASRRA